MKEIIDRIFNEELDGDMSFLDDGVIGLHVYVGTQLYSAKETRQAYHDGIRRGIEIGLRKAWMEQRRLPLPNMTLRKSQEFLEKFYRLTQEYNCSMQFELGLGITVRPDFKPEPEL